MGEHIKIKRGQLNREWIDMGVFLVILLFLQLFLQTGLGDDSWFAEDSRPLGKYLRDRYQGWTSRLLVEAILKLLAAAPDWIWRMMNVLIVLLLVWIVADLFGIEKDNTRRQAKVFFFVLMWCVPMACISESGWIVTTLNYLWPLTLGLVAARPIKHWTCGERCSVWEYVVCPFCMLFGANVEQGGALLLGVYLLAGVYMLRYKKRLLPFYFVMLFLAAASIVFIMTAPGNASRVVKETETWFPEFAGLNITQKLLMGFIDTANYYLAAGGSKRENYLFALLAGIQLVGIWQKRKERWFMMKAVVAVLPLLFFWGIGKAGLYWLLNRGFRYGGHIVGLLGLNRCLPTGAGIFRFFGWMSYSMEMVLLQAGVYLALLICVAMTIFFLHGRSRETLFEFVILGAGLLSRLIMGFSPTLYASASRSTLYCSVAILIVCLRNLQIYWNKHAEKKESIVLAAYIAWTVCSNLRW